MCAAAGCHWFFFQAEDGIRDLTVTGVQTCALPICDLFALVKDPNVRVLYTLRGVSELAHVDEAWIRAKYGIPGDRYYDYAVLRGDPSDGLPGVHGIGEKTASALVAKHGSLDAILTATDVSDTIPAKLRADAVFFFQAEDGIRDLTVTGVQTCALPI